jgi:signal transduction histidine kinase
MINRNNIGRRSRLLLMISGLVLILAVGFVDYLTGTELSMAIFYLIPIVLTSWFVGWRIGCLLSLAGSATEYVAGVLGGHIYSHPIIGFWNFAVRVVFFLIAVTILAILKAQYRKTLQLVQDLQHALMELNATQAALERKTKELARSNSDLQHFAYTAAHDLRQPLLIVQSYLLRLSKHCKDQLPPEAEEPLKRSMAGAARMESLINALLSYAQVGVNGSPFSPTDFDQIVERVIADLRNEITASGAMITREKLPALLVRDTQIYQLFLNLIGNGLKFRGEHPPAIHISAREEKNEWIFSVKDNGIGIKSEHISRIFDLFERFHGSTELSGAGIGLATCKRVVESHGGRIWVDSAPGMGSTFHFTIPMSNSRGTPTAY